MIRRLAHVCILARDLEATEDFYCNVLGLEKRFDFEKNGVRVGFYIAIGDDTFIEVFKGEFGTAPSALVHFCIEVDSIDELRRRLTEHGVESWDKRRGSDHSWQTRCNDPNGIVIEFHEYTEQSMQLRGGVAHVNW